MKNCLYADGWTVARGCQDNDDRIEFSVRAGAVETVARMDRREAIRIARAILDQALTDPTL